MRGSFLIFGLSVSGLVTLAGCAHTAPAIAPQTTLAAVIEVAPKGEASQEIAEPAPEAAPVERVTHPVDITVDHLPLPKRFAPHAATYVFWIRASDDDAWTNATHLNPSKTQETTTFAWAQENLLVNVTAEASADVRLPSDKVVLSARVSRDGACAAGVDQNDVTMKVRMCR